MTTALVPDVDGARESAQKIAEALEPLRAEATLYRQDLLRRGFDEQRAEQMAAGFHDELLRDLMRARRGL